MALASVQVLSFLTKVFRRGADAVKDSLQATEVPSNAGEGLTQKIHRSLKMEFVPLEFYLSRRMGTRS